MASDRGRGRGPVVEGRVEDDDAGQVGSDGIAGMRAGVARVPAGAVELAAGDVGLAAGDAQAGNDRIIDLLTLLVERLPERVPSQAPVVVEVQPRVVAAAGAGELSSFVGMMEQMHRIGTRFFSGGANPRDAEAWLVRLERNFLSCGCPVGYQVDIAVHFLEGDAHLWWRSVTARRVQTGMVWAVFVGEFYSRFCSQEGLKDRVVGGTPSFQVKGVQQRAGPSKGSKPMQGQKRKWDGASGGSRSGLGCYGCGSTDHRVASCPQKGRGRVGSRVCYHCREFGHIRVDCPKLPQVVPIAAVPIRTIPAEPFVVSTVESGEASSRPVTGNFLRLV